MKSRLEARKLRFTDHSLGIRIEDVSAGKIVSKTALEVSIVVIRRGACGLFRLDPAVEIPQPVFGPLWNAQAWSLLSQ